ncbi:MAG: nicotinate-nucleotide--dimethylbenzimidazole phosphoribosyltransferase [Jatrophihabitantaceae bacterium]
MSDLVGLGADVEWSDNDAATAVRNVLTTTNEDPGRLGDLAEWMAGVQGRCPPQDFARVRIVVFGGPPGTLHAGAAVQAIAELTGTAVRVVARQEGGTSQALSAGAALADDEIDGGADLLVVALQGLDAGTPALALVSILTNTEPVKVLPRGTRLSPEVWMQLAIAVRDTRRRGMAHRGEPAALLEAINCADVAACAAFLLRAAGRRTPVLLDGLPAAAAALVAYEAQPRAVRWWQSADLSAEPAHALALTKLGMRSVLDLGIGLADGTAGLLAVPVMRAAVHILARLDPARAEDAEAQS